jgi:DNA polymerase III delta subunit
MKVEQLIEALKPLPPDAVVLIESDGGLSLVANLEFLAAEGPGAPAEVILLPSMDE